MATESIEPTTHSDIQINAEELRAMPHAKLYQHAIDLGIRIRGDLGKAELIAKILGLHCRNGATVIAPGILDIGKDNFGILRDPDKSFLPDADDLYVGGNFIKEFHLKPGQKLKVLLKAPRNRDKFLAVSKILEIDGQPAEDFSPPRDFEDLTPLFPKQRLLLDGKGEENHAVRVVDLIAPLGKGQRGLIVAPPRGGKTILLKQIARAIRKNNPEVELIVLLLDERPEEVTDFEETVDANVFASTFDEPPARHAQVSELVLERAKRLVELGKDVVILLDSLTRLARGHNASQSGGKIMSGGLGANALAKPRKFFGSARNVEEGGSLTILATALIETESRMDEVIFEEFKGTGNMEVKLDRELAERRVYPAIHIAQSGTRNDDRIYHPDEFPRVLEIRREIAKLPIGDALIKLLKNIKKTETNAALLMTGLRD